MPRLVRSGGQRAVLGSEAGGAEVGPADPGTREQVGDYLVMVVARRNPAGGSTGSSGRQTQRGRTRDVEKQAKMDFTDCL